MNLGLQKLGIVIRDLLSVSESNIFIGRSGFRREDLTGRQIVVESIGPATRLNNAEVYDGTAESMEYSQRLLAPCTINFYGDTSYADATNFSLRLLSQAGVELQRDNELSVHGLGQLTDVKMLTGEQYSGRIEVSLMIQYTISINVDTLRIDEEQFTILED